MKKEKTPSESPSKEKAEYQFGKIEKVVLETKEMELAVFACADPWPGDGRDPTRSPPIS